MSAYHRFKKGESDAPVIVEGTINYGLAKVPYCEIQKCWLLPAGPKQKQRKVKSYGDAMRFAKLINGMLAGVPMNRKH